MLELEQSYRAVTKTFRSQPNVADGMAALLQWCRKQVPNPVWDDIAGLDFESDVNHLRSWLAGTLAEEPPAASINGFWFGLFETGSEEGISGCELYVSGSTQFEPQNASDDWPCWDDDSYLPQGRYADSRVLNAIYEIAAKGGEIAADAQYIMALGYAGLAVMELCNSIEPELLATPQQARAVAVGFDSGDVLLLGTIDAGGKWKKWKER